ncbi:hypothetical protein RhiTH_005572 [Rhizoctonia solani]
MGTGITTNKSKILDRWRKGGDGNGDGGGDGDGDGTEDVEDSGDGGSTEDVDDSGDGDRGMWQIRGSPHVIELPDVTELSYPVAVEAAST